LFLRSSREKGEKGEGRREKAERGEGRRAERAEGRRQNGKMGNGGGEDGKLRGPETESWERERRRRNIAGNAAACTVRAGNYFSIECGCRVVWPEV
jgi:hypothetical protein